MMNPTHHNHTPTTEIFVNEEWKQDSHADDNNENDNPSTTTRPRQRTPFLFSKFLYSSLNKNDNHNSDDNGQRQSPKRWMVLLLGQIIAFLLSSAGATQATLHLNCQISIPTLSTAFVYVVLTFSLVPYYYYHYYYYSDSNDSLVSPQTATTTTISTNDDNINDILQVQLHNQEQQQEDAVHTTTNDKSNRSLPVASCDSDVLRIDNNPVITSARNSARSSSRTPSSSSSLPPSYSLGGIIPLHSSVWSYFLIAFLDVEANYVTVLAFQYTTITSVNLLDALAIPTAMIVSRLLLKRTYVRVHIMGACLCMIGIVMNVWADRNSSSSSSSQSDDTNQEEQEQQYPHRVWGDVLAIGGGLLWGINNVVQEYVIQHSGNPLEVLGMIGFGGTLISIVQIAILERDDLQELFGITSENVNDDENVDDSMMATCNTRDKLLLVGAYVVCVSSVYVGGAYFLLYSEAALYNLSLLTSDAWTVIFSVVAEHIIPPPLFFIAMSLIVSGVVLYETGPSPILVVVLDNDDDADHNNGTGKQQGHDVNDGHVELSVYQAEPS